MFMPSIPNPPIMCLDNDEMKGERHWNLSSASFDWALTPCPGLATNHCTAKVTQGH